LLFAYLLFFAYFAECNLLSPDSFKEIIKKSAINDTRTSTEPFPDIATPSTPIRHKFTGHNPSTPQHLSVLLLSPCQSPMLSQSPLSQGRIMMVIIMRMFSFRVVFI